MSKQAIISKKIGILVGDEYDWPSAFGFLMKRLGRSISYKKKDYAFSVESLRIHPFSLAAQNNSDIIIDRLAYWHDHPREWLKKVAFMNKVYLLNNPFTFQSMEKHTAYCAMLRLGLNIPETWLLPSKEGVEDNSFEQKYQRTSEYYHDMFDLPSIAKEIGYPLFMKPFDGGGWRGVSRIDNEFELMQSYDKSGSKLMLLQKGLLNYEFFVRSLGIGSQVISLDYHPSQPMHERYQIQEDFLDAARLEEVQRITKIVNAFFRWDFNSCEVIVKDGIAWPMDFANACPDVAVLSLHYYFPWAMKSLVAWSIFSAVTERTLSIGVDVEPYFAIADNPEMSYEEKLESYTALADKYFDTANFEDFYATVLSDMDEILWEYVASKEFDTMLIKNVRNTFPEHEHDDFIEHFRAIFARWLTDHKQ